MNSGLPDGSMGGTERVGLISFIVPAWNEEEWLDACLSAIRSASVEVGVPHEIVVANDGSTDGTGGIARRLADSCVDVENRKISATRNAGARAARGDLLVFVDADTLIEASVVRGVLRAIGSGAVGGGCRVGFDRPVPLWHRPGPWFFNAYQRRYSIAFGCFLFCTRAAFDAVGGFDEGLYIAEEISMSMRLKRLGAFVIVPERVVTSGRKLVGHSPWELGWLLFRGLLTGPEFLRRPEGKRIWYGERKEKR